MGRFFEAERETWYFGGGSESLSTRGVLAGLEDFFLSCEVVFAVSDGAEAVDGDTESAFAGLDEVFVGLLSARGCFEGSVGLGSGGCALSPSVRDSAAARSAARWASWGVEGCSEEAFGGREGVVMGVALAGGSKECQSVYM
jgi:hypothetical protein